MMPRPRSMPASSSMSRRTSRSARPSAADRRSLHARESRALDRPHLLSRQIQGSGRVAAGRGVARDRRAPPGRRLRPRQVRPAEGRLHLLPVADQPAAGSVVLDDGNEFTRGVEYLFPNAPIPLALRGGFWHDPDHAVRYDPSPALDDIDRLFMPLCPAATRRPTTPSGPDWRRPAGWKSTARPTSPPRPNT